MNSFIRLAKAAEFLEVEKHVLRKWLEAWEPFASREVRERSAMHFTLPEFLFLWVAKELVIGAGMSRDTVKLFSAELFMAIQKHWSQKSERTLLVQKPLGQAWVVGGKEKSPAIRIELPMAEMRGDVFRILGISDAWVQREIPVGLVAAKR